MEYLLSIPKILDEREDPRCQGDIFLRTSFIAVLLAVYYFFILYLGPIYMKNRPAFNLNKLLIVYNILQIIISAYIPYEILQLKFDSFTLKCQSIDYSDSSDALRALRVTYLYYLVKVVDLLDTVFFVFRKKYNQITLLHTLHHGVLLSSTWSIAKYYGGGSALFLPFLNSCIHVVMYSYYLLAIYNTEYKKSVWWKKYITQLQMVQFLLNVLVSLCVIISDNCNIPKPVPIIFAIQNVTLIFLFTDFYLKAYVKKNV